MLLTEKDINSLKFTGSDSPLAHYAGQVQSHLPPDEAVIRFAVTGSESREDHCELGVLTEADLSLLGRLPSVFKFRRRRTENVDRFNAALVIPTGVGAEIGGHAGDAGPVARLLSAACDTVITHPNVVNASDINELPENGLYVEGSVLARLLMGTVGLERVRSNRVLVVIDEHDETRISELAINAVSAARAAFGLNCPRVVKLDPSIEMSTRFSSSGSAVGRVEHLERLLDVLSAHRAEYNAVAIASVIDVPKGFHWEYFESHGEMVNPWGGVEAMLTHAVSTLLDVPSAHAPMLESMEILNETFGLVDPRMAAEAISNCFIHSVLQGLHRSPRIVTDRSLFGRPNVVTAEDVSCLVIPDGCVGLPTLAALEQGIPVIAVRENRNCMRNDLKTLPFPPGKLLVVDNYLEAVGVMAALKAGVSVPSVRRPLAPTVVTTERSEGAVSDRAAGSDSVEARSEGRP